MDGQKQTNSRPTQMQRGYNMPPALLKAQQEKFIDYLALGGLITKESDDITKPNDIKQLTVTEFCKQIGIGHDTYYRWRRTIPNLGELVRQRRYELFSIARETAVYNRLYLIGMTGKSQPAVEALKVLAGHFAKLDLPIQRQEIKNEGESWAALVEQKQKEIIEGEIVNDPQLQNHEPQDPHHA